MKTFKTPNGVFALVRLSLIVVLEAYQRDRRPNHLNKLRNNWNPNYCGTLAVVPQPDGTYHAADGAHRFTILKEKAGNKNPLILVQLVDKFEDFLPLNMGLSVNRNEEFKIMLNSGHQPYKRVAAALKKHGIGIHYGSKPRLGFTAAPAAFLDMFKATQQKGLDFEKAVSTLLVAFSRKNDGNVDPSALGADFVRGYTTFLVGSNYTWEEVGAALQNSPNTAGEIALLGRQRATNGGGRWKEIASILRGIVYRHNSCAKKAA